MRETGLYYPYTWIECQVDSVISWDIIITVIHIIINHFGLKHLGRRILENGVLER